MACGLLGLLLSGCTMNVFPLEDSGAGKDRVIQITVEDTQADTAVQENALADLAESDLIYLFTEKCTEHVIADYYGDFDHDGFHEAFVITGDVLNGPVDSADTIYGKLWLVNSRSVQLAAEDFSGVSSDIAIWNFENRDYLAVSKSYLSGNLTYLWTVVNDMPKRDSVSGLGDIRNDNGRLYVAQITEDAMLDQGKTKGQTIKYYDMYYDGLFHEYGAIAITESRFLEYGGSTQILDKLEKDYPGAEFEILFHDNQVIYINIAHQMDEITYYHSAIVDLDAQEQVTLREVIEGKYKKALLKEIANYPSR